MVVLREYNKCHDPKDGRFANGPCEVGEARRTAPNDPTHDDEVQYARADAMTARVKRTDTDLDHIAAFRAHYSALTAAENAGDAKRTKHHSKALEKHRRWLRKFVGFGF